MTIPCGETIGHGETCSSGWLCENCQEKSQAAQEERARIVAWLRKNAELNPHLPEAKALVILFSEAIKDGVHLQKQSK